MLKLTPDIETSPPYDEMRKLYAKRFSLGHLNTDINSKFALISLICYVTNKLKDKKPSVNHYNVIRSIIKSDDLPEDFIKGLAVVCEDFSYGCTEFPTFNIEPKNMPSTIQNILKNYLPF